MNILDYQNGNVKDYTIILSTRDYRHLGKLTGVTNVHYAPNENSANEFSFNISKYDLFQLPAINMFDIKKAKKIKQAIWNQIEDFKLIYVKELDEYFEIYVRTVDSLHLSKNITATSLCEAELSQTKITTEINTEADISRDDYEVTTFCNKSNPKASLLHRVILSKMPHYSIGHVDESLCDIQRAFSLNEQWIYDFLTGECSEQFNCIFKFDSKKREVSAYDLYTICNDCGERGDYYSVCPKCGSKNLKQYGKDTSIYVDKNNLTESIELSMNPDSVKNCFKLEAGDDLMTSTVRLLNMGNSDYIVHIPEYQQKDMPKELVDKLDAYDKLCNSKQKEHDDLVQKFYNLTDDILYLESGMLPTIEQSEVTASTEAKKLTVANLSPVALSSVTSSTSVTTVNSALKSYAKVYVKTGYVKIDVESGATFSFVGKDSSGNSYGTWKGKFKVTNYSDEEDVAYSSTLSIKVYDNYGEFANQKVLKQMSQEENKEGSVFDVLAIEDVDKFAEALTFYNKSRLESFRDAIQEAIDVLIQMDEGTVGSLLYDDMYVGYYNKLCACENELDKRQKEIDNKQAKLDSITKKLQTINNKLNFETYLGNYYKAFCAYKREDTYSNANYISDGLNNKELIDRANEFLEVAKRELRKSAEQQISITSTLYNLLAIDAFKPIVNNFELGNWIRIKVDGVIYRLRLIGYSINFDNLSNIEVTFANVSRLKNEFSDEKFIRDSVHSMSSSYAYVSKQAEKGNTAQNNINSWMNDSLKASNIQISNSDNNDVTFGKRGILCRHLNDITGKYDDKQLIVTYNTLAFTTNNWKSVEQVIGEHNFIAYDKTTNTWITKSGYGMTANFVQAGWINGATIVGGETYSSNYSDGSNGTEKKGSYVNWNDGTFSYAGGNLIYDGTKLILGNADITQSLINTGIVTDDLYIDASRITGQISSGQIKNIDASQVISGTFVTERIPNLDASKIASGTFASARIPSLNANKINDGVFAVGRIPDLDGEKIIIGSLPSDRIEDTISGKILDSCIIQDGTINIGDTSINSTNGLNTNTGYIGNLQTRSITVYDNTNIARVGITGTYEVGESSLTFIDGVLVGVA